MKKPRIAVVHNVPAAPGHPAAAASLDVLDQVDAVERALQQLEYDFTRIPLTRDLAAFIERLRRETVDAVFNLCETVDEDASLAAHPAAIFELLGLPFTGAPSRALTYTTDKATAKLLMAASGISTPRFTAFGDGAEGNLAALSPPLIVKPRFEDGGIGIDGESVFERTGQLRDALPALRERFGAVIVEEYIAGREFNVSLFGYPEPEVLPVAEIDFSAFPDRLYPVLGYRAKWDRDSFEYRNSTRRFPRELPRRLREALHDAALRCFRLFGVRDYGRVDLRVTADGVVFVLEVNANPCLSPDAGFAAALEYADVSCTAMVEHMITWTLRRAGRS